MTKDCLIKYQIVRPIPTAGPAHQRRDFLFGQFELFQHQDNLVKFLGFQFGQIYLNLFYLFLGLQIGFIIILSLNPISSTLSVLAHHDDRRLQGGKRRQDQVQQDEGVGVGLGAARIRELFQQAKEKGPALVFIDEIDSLVPARGGGFLFEIAQTVLFGETTRGRPAAARRGRRRQSYEIRGSAMASRRCATSSTTRTSAMAADDLTGSDLEVDVAQALSRAHADRFEQEGLRAWTVREGRNHTEMDNK